MSRYLGRGAAVGLLLTGAMLANPTLAQKQGGVLKIYHRDSPASMSILEEATISTVLPMMGVFNNLAMPTGSPQPRRLCANTRSPAQDSSPRCSDDKWVGEVNEMAD